MKYGKKQLLLLALSLIIAGLAASYLATNYGPKINPEVTELAIFIDLPAQTAGNDAIPHEFIKAIDATCNYILLNVNLFKASLQFLVPEALLGQWDLYDTGKGVIYMHYKTDQNPEAVGFRVKEFKKLDNLDKQTIANLSKEGKWAQNFSEFFDLPTWKQYHSPAHRSLMIYINGHGLPRSPDEIFNLCCSLSLADFTQIFKFMHNELLVDVFVIQSCYWTAPRLLELIQKTDGIQSLRCTIISPLEKERALHLEAIGNFLKHTTPCFFDGCREVAYAQQHTFDKELTYLVTNTDTVQLAENGGQKPTIIPAGTTQRIEIA